MTALSDTSATGTEAGTKSFTYDANGNMITDGRKGLELRWNVLNLVDSAGMHGSSLKYAWLSDGTKVSARADDGQGNGVQKRYLGSFVYTSSGGSSADVPTEVESVAWDEGRIFFNVPVAVEEVVPDPEGDSGGGDPDPEGIVEPVALDTLAWVSRYRDCWFAGDHLGNVRSVIDITPDLVVPEVLEQNDYLPYGTRIQNPDFAATPTGNRWRYAAKEEQDFNPYGSLNLSLLDFGARMYDPFIARWTAVDPLASHVLDNSPYNYCIGNPTLFFDSTGCVPWAIYGADLVAEAILISTGAITIGILLKKNADGSISFNWNPGFDWQRRKEREASDKAREDDLNHQKMLDNNGNSEKPKFFEILDALAQLLDTNRPLFEPEEKTTEQEPNTSQPELSPASGTGPSTQQTNESEQELIKLLNRLPNYD